MEQEREDWKEGGLKRRAHDRLMNRLDALELSEDEYDEYYAELFDEEVAKVQRRDKYMYYEKRRIAKEKGTVPLVKFK